MPSGPISRMAWAQSEGAYAQLQSTKPQTLTYALNDSPAGLAGWFLEKFRAWSDCGDDVIAIRARDGARVEVPTAVTMFPKDIVPAPREFAERWFDIRHWTQMPRGGHFAAWEQPQLLAGELRSFLATVERS
jgi:pimeloyl-ACP methyl ester carboxylesterase